MSRHDAATCRFPARRSTSTSQSQSTANRLSTRPLPLPRPCRRGCRLTEGWASTIHKRSCPFPRVSTPALKSEQSRRTDIGAISDRIASIPTCFLYSLLYFRVVFDGITSIQPTYFVCSVPYFQVVFDGIGSTPRYFCVMNSISKLCLTGKLYFQDAFHSAFYF